MPSEPLSTFHYHACAHAFSARFTRPFEHQIDAQAASALPIIGGHGQARVENFQFREFLSFRKAYTHVSGANEKGPDGRESHNTLVISAIEGLNILDVLTADRIVARVYSKYELEKKEKEKGKKEKQNEEGSFTIAGSRFENLRIADCDVKIKLDLDTFEKVPTYASVLKNFENSGDFFKIAHDPFRTGRSIESPGPNGVFLCSCVKEVKLDCAGVTQVGHAFSVPGFGKIFLGELVIKHGHRTLTMIRLEIGSAVSATGTVVQADSNGKPYPPGG
jgi:hypothetical protein